MGQPAAKEDDRVTATDTHIVMVPSSTGEVPTLQQLLFSGAINGTLSKDVKIMGKKAATVDSTADNLPKHMAIPPGTRFQSPPANRGTIKTGSATVKINGKAAARNADTAETCNDPTDLPVGTVVASGTVLIG